MSRRSRSIEVVDVPERHRFEIRVDGERAGHAEYARKGDRLIFTHTEIDDAYEGRGLGSKLAGGALDAARAGDHPVVPLCPFIASFVEQAPRVRRPRRPRVPRVPRDAKRERRGGLRRHPVARAPDRRHLPRRVRARSRTVSRPRWASGSLTFAEMNAAANAHALRRSADVGVRHGDRVVLWSNTSLDAVPVFAALAKLGAVFAPANAILGVDEATEMAALARPALLVVDDDHEAGGGEIADRLGIPLAVLGRIVADGARRSRRAARARRCARPTRTSCSSPVGAPGGRRAWCCRTG